MSATEIYNILNLITNVQKKEHYLLEFNVKDGIVKNLISYYRDTADLDDIVEVSYSSPTTSKKSVENN
jgi:HSP90 family molecular chaperone